MINYLLSLWVKSLLWLRYKVVVRGAREIAAGGRRGILFLSNHVALIDPIILAVYLHRRFSPKFLADRDQIDRPVVRWLAKRVGVVAMPNIARDGAESSREIRRAMEQIIEHLKAGGNALLYPAGRLCHTRLEDLRGNSAVETILKDLPDVRVVLVRTRGLWGSSFGWGRGRAPDVAGTLKKGAVSMLLSGLLFMPRRKVTIELHEPVDLPRNASRNTINRYLEDFYNADAPPAIEVPMTIWQRGGPRLLPEPERTPEAGGIDSVPQATRKIVTDHLRDLTGKSIVADGDHLARDLGLDSLARTELLVWLEGQFGLAPGDSDTMVTVADVMLAACGEGISATYRRIKAVPRKWFSRGRAGRARATSWVRPGHAAHMPQGDTITEVFLNQAARSPDRVIIADQTSGARSYRDVIAGVVVLSGRIEELPGKRVGVMLPASVAADIVYLAVLFAGKIPVMVNWTGGPRGLGHSLDLADVRRIVTAGALVRQLGAEGHDFGRLAERFVMLENVVEKISPAERLKAFLEGRIRWPKAKGAATDTAAILFTSGSESLPKAVPLTHRNILANIRDVLSVVSVYQSDRIIGILPPFHSFGLTATVLVPLLAGVPAVYHPNPNQAAVLAGVIEAYKATVLMGTPTFLGGIVRAARPGQLDPLRLSVTGAEKCSQRVYSALAASRPGMTILEGYGVTECSPIISLNDQAAPKPFTIGKVLPSLEHAIVDVDTGGQVPPGQVGMLLVRGQSVFGGYLNYDGESPFVQFDGRQWYRTGDLISEDSAGVLTFHGRLKRFVKLGGEMISLPAIETVLEPHYHSEGQEGPAIAVAAAGDEYHPELVLFTTAEADRQTVNARIREGGLSALHNIRRVIKLDEIPLLPAGKTDYRALRRKLGN